MKRLVLKFGGTSVMDTRRIQRVAEITLATAAQGYQVVVVVSAMGHTTDRLIDLAQEVQRRPSPRELDTLLATGEQMSAALVAMSIQSLGGQARSLTGGAAGIKTDSSFTRARIDTINPKPLEELLAKGCIPVVAGFQGIDGHGDLTTLGRGGSDTTAIVLAAALHADRCDIYTDVDGVYTADPRVLSNAYRVEQVSYDDMLRLSRTGAKVLAAYSVEIALQKKVKVRVRSTFKPTDEGTLVTSSSAQNANFTGIASDSGKACVKICLYQSASLERKMQREFRHERFKMKRTIASMLLGAGIAADFGRSVRNSGSEIPICVAKENILRVTNLLRNAAASLEIKEIAMHALQRVPFD